ncbi:MAG: ATP-binding protein [Gemmatimonadaceae bacterium]
MTLSRRLHEASNLVDVMDHVVTAITAETRYQRAWLTLPIVGSGGVEVIGYALPERTRVDQRMASLDIAKDPWIQFLLSTTEPIVVDDLRELALADQEQVAYFGNRTLIAVPMLRLAERVGAFCVGTFAEEGVLPPKAEELEFVVQVGTLVSVVAGRLRAEGAQRVLEEQVRSAQRLESLGRMAGEIAHDFNNMLVSIVGNTDLVKEMLAGHPAQELILEIEQAATRATGLTRQLLAFSRGQPFERREVHLGAVVDGFLPILRSLVPANVALEISNAAELGAVDGDPGQIEQVLMNLVVNARDALPNGGTIRVATEAIRIDAASLESHATMPLGDYVVLSVADTGVGIPGDIVGRLFEPFFTTKAAGAGTGLGLAVVDSIVRRHDGFVNAHSVEAQGTTFTVYFPVSVRPLEDTAARPSIPEALHEGHEHVLLVDDDEQVRSLLVRVLSGAGYRVSVAEDGQAALELLESLHDVDLVLTDLVMPRLGGRALRDILRERPGAPAVLVMSGYAPGAEERGTFEHVISKPFAPADLLRKLRELLGPSA